MIPNGAILGSLVLEINGWRWNQIKWFSFQERHLYKLKIKEQKKRNESEHKIKENDRSTIKNATTKKKPHTTRLPRQLDQLQWLAFIWVDWRYTKENAEKRVYREKKKKKKGDKRQRKKKRETKKKKSEKKKCEEVGDWKKAGSAFAGWIRKIHGHSTNTHNHCLLSSSRSNHM